MCYPAPRREGLFFAMDACCRFRGDFTWNMILEITGEAPFFVVRPFFFGPQSRGSLPPQNLSGEQIGRLLWGPEIEIPPLLPPLPTAHRAPAGPLPSSDLIDYPASQSAEPA